MANQIVGGIFYWSMCNNYLKMFQSVCVSGGREGIFPIPLDYFGTEQSISSNNILTWNHCNVITFVITDRSRIKKTLCQFWEYWSTRMVMSLKYQWIRSKISKFIVIIHTFLGQLRINYSKFTNSPSFLLTG